MINKVYYNITDWKKSFLLDIKDKEPSSIHCHLALKDVLNTLVNKKFSKIDYIYTTENIIIKIDSFSFKLHVPITCKNLKEFVSHIKHYIDMDKHVIERLFLEYTDLKKIGGKYCIDCRLNENCQTMFAYFESE
jgi:hypothetical protein